MRRRPQLWLLPALLASAAAALPATSALAAGTVRLSSATFSARESDRAATITVERSVTSGHGEVRYAIWQHSAVENVDYVRVSGRLNFADGQATASFDVPIVDDDLIDGNTIHCNPPGRGLGPRPTTAVPARYPHLDAFAWVGQPGRSAGACSATPGAPRSGTFWVDYALALIANADYRIR